MGGCCIGAARSRRFHRDGPVRELLQRPAAQAGGGEVVQAAVLHVAAARGVEDLHLARRQVHVRTRPAGPRRVEARVRLWGNDNLQRVALGVGALEVCGAAEADGVAPATAETVRMVRRTLVYLRSSARSLEFIGHKRSGSPCTTYRCTGRSSAAGGVRHPSR